jgi:acyl-CoA hydrolase
VTEFGAANLEGLSSTERELKLIELAYPEFRDHLTEAAKHFTSSERAPWQTPTSTGKWYWRRSQVSRLAA